MTVERANLALRGGAIGRAAIARVIISRQLHRIMSDGLRGRGRAAHIIGEHADVGAAGGIAGGAVLHQRALQGHEERAAVGRQRHAFRSLIVASAGVRRLQRAEVGPPAAARRDRFGGLDYAAQPPASVEIIDVRGIFVANVEAAIARELQRFSVERHLAFAHGR